MPDDMMPCPIGFSVEIGSNGIENAAESDEEEKFPKAILDDGLEEEETQPAHGDIQKDSDSNPLIVVFIGDNFEEGSGKSDGPNQGHEEDPGEALSQEKDGGGERSRNEEVDGRVVKDPEDGLDLGRLDGVVDGGTKKEPDKATAIDGIGNDAGDGLALDLG